MTKTHNKILWEFSNNNPYKHMHEKTSVVKDDRKLGDHHVTIRNDLVTAAQGLKTLAEQRVVKACVAQLDSKHMDRGRYRIKLSAADYAQLHGLDLNTAYEQLKDVTKTLMDRIIVRYEAGPRGKIITHRDHWVTGCTYHDGQAWVEVRFSHEATPYLLQLRGNHTTYLLQQAAEFRSIYSWRLLEVLMQYKDTGWRQISTDDLCIALEAQASQRKNFAEFRRTVLHPAIKELTEKDGWTIDYKPIVMGRKVTALRFNFKRNPQQRLDV